LGLKISEEIQVQILDASYAAYEHLLAIIPGNWKKVILHRTPSNGELTVTKLSVVGERNRGREEGVNFDYVTRVKWLSEALNRLQIYFREEGIVWDGLTATVSRMEEESRHVQLELLTVREGSLVSVLLEEPQRDALFSDNFIHWGKQMLPQLRSLQKSWMTQWGAGLEKLFDLKSGTVTFQGEESNTVVRKFQILSVYQVEKAEWYWAWYLSDFSDELKELSQQILSTAQPGVGMFNVLRRPVFNCEPSLAEDIALLAVERTSALEGYLVMERIDVGDRLYMGVMVED
jgi:hypothetical protein